jgi:diguanylate cyclase (GGDEF)-like protein
VSIAKCSLLIVDDEPYILPTLAALLSRDFEVLTAESAEAARAVFARRPIDILMTDQKMPRETGVQLLEWVREHSPKTIRVLMTGYAELDDAVDAINRGHVYYYLMKPWRTEELHQVLRNAAEKFQLERSREHLLDELRQLNLELEQRVRDRTRELEEANHLLQQRTRELERLALTDPLTGMLNRRAIDDVIRSEFNRRARYPGPLSIALIDVDHFREINNRFLHTGGDEVLIGLCRVLSGSLRSVDTVGRIGGEEFLVVAPETNLEGASTLGERIRSTVENTPIYYNQQEINITASLGFAVVETDIPANYEGMKLLAASALSEAKNTGRNRCVIRMVQESLEQVC